MKVSRKALPEDIAESRISKGPVSISATDVFGVAEGPIPELMVIKQRAGKGILSESLERIAPVLNPNAQEMLTEWAEKAKPSRDPEGVKTTKWVESFDRKREILDMLHLFHDRPLNYMETVALLAVRHGLDKEKLLPYVRDLFQMSQCGIVNLGGISGLYSSIKDNLPVKIENILEDSPRPITGDEIGRSLGYNMDVSQRERNSILYRINASLNLLETVNHVVKLPKDKSLTVWIHPKYRYSPETVPEWNLKYKVLKVLYGQSKISGAGTVKDGMMKGDIASSDEIGEVVERKEKPSLMSRKIDYALSDLRRFGLVKAEERMTDPSHPSVTFYSLTDDAKEWVSITIREQRLHEDLRKALLGEHFEGLSERELDMLDKIQRWIKVRRQLDEDIHKGETEIASSLGEKLTYVRKVKSGNVPWGRGQANRETLEKYVDFIEDEEDQNWFKSFLESNDETPIHEKHMLSRVKMWIEMKKAVEDNPGKGSRAIATILKNKTEFTDSELASVTWTEKPIRKVLERLDSTPWVTQDLDAIWNKYSSQLNETQRELFKRYLQEIRDYRQVN